MVNEDVTQNPQPGATAIDRGAGFCYSPCVRQGMRELEESEEIDMAKEKKQSAKDMPMKERVQERVKGLKQKVTEKRKASEKLMGDADFRSTRKTLKRLQRKLRRISAMEKRAESKRPKAAEQKPAEAGSAGASA